VRVGHVHEIPAPPAGTTAGGASGTPAGPADAGTVRLVTLSMQPLIFEVKDVLSETECAWVRETSEPTLVPSAVVNQSGRGAAVRNEAVRTSSNTMRSAREPESAVLQRLDARIARITALPASHGEDLQVLRYEEGQRYSAHLDAFPPEHYRGRSRFFQHGHFNRLATFFLYLSGGDQEGGETFFPSARGGPTDPDPHSCDPRAAGRRGGLWVHPEAGKAILFYNLGANGAVDPLSLHAGCPPGKGRVKWAANKWLWNKEGAVDGLGDGSREDSLTGEAMGRHAWTSREWSAFWSLVLGGSA
jgi:prolyl 4-hydroxylase